MFRGSVGEGEAELKQYVSQVCLACGRVHMVNPRTGKLMSEEFQPRDEGQGGNALVGGYETCGNRNVPSVATWPGNKGALL
jgi:hypothetical protein